MNKYSSTHNIRRSNSPFYNNYLKKSINEQENSFCKPQSNLSPTPIKKSYFNNFPNNKMNSVETNITENWYQKKLNQIGSKKRVSSPLHLSFNEIQNLNKKNNDKIVPNYNISKKVYLSHKVIKKDFFDKKKNFAHNCSQNKNYKDFFFSDSYKKKNSDNLKQKNFQKNPFKDKNKKEVFSHNIKKIYNENNKKKTINNLFGDENTYLNNGKKNLQFSNSKIIKSKDLDKLNYKISKSPVKKTRDITPSRNSYIIPRFSKSPQVKENIKLEKSLKNSIFLRISPRPNINKINNFNKNIYFAKRNKIYVSKNNYFNHSSFRSPNKKIIFNGKKNYTYNDFCNSSKIIKINKSPNLKKHKNNLFPKEYEKKNSHDKSRERYFDALIEKGFIKEKKSRSPTIRYLSNYHREKSKSKEIINKLTKDYTSSSSFNIFDKPQSSIMKKKNCFESNNFDYAKKKVRFNMNNIKVHFIPRKTFFEEKRKNSSLLKFRPNSYKVLFK